MKKFFVISALFFTPLLWIGAGLRSQSSVNLEGGEVFSTFKFKDSKGVSDNNYSHSIGNTFGLAYQYIGDAGIFARVGINMRKAGATLIDGDVFYTWSLQYADFKAGVGYQFNKWRVRPYMAVFPYYARLLNATQTINSDSYDIKHNKSITNSDFGLFLTPGINVILSNYISIFAEYSYILGLQNIQTYKGQQSYNRGFSINFGVSMGITKIGRLNKTRLD